MNLRRMSDAKFVGGHDVDMRRNWWERSPRHLPQISVLNKRIVLEFWRNGERRN